MEKLPELFVSAPAVFVVRDTYQIMVLVNAPALMWVKVGDNTYYDESNGILRSNVLIHRITVPMEELDNAKSYTVCYRKIIERKPYYTESEDEVCYTVPFKPVSGEPIHIYHIADCHNKVDSPVAAGKYWQDKLDILILNGDVIHHSGEIENFKVIYDIAGQITGGTLPIIFSRGNHDMRGFYGENMADYSPTDNGNSYYTFRLGNIWGVILDCGEDKPDDHEHYAYTICCHAFRKRQTRFLENIVKNAATEYEAPGVEHKLVVVHNPFTDTLDPPFDIEIETFSEWAAILKEHVKPDLMISGHMHDIRVDFPGGDHDFKGQPCPIVVGSKPYKKLGDYFIGAAIKLEKDNINVRFTDTHGEVTDEVDIPRQI